MSDATTQADKTTAGSKWGVPSFDFSDDNFSDVGGDLGGLLGASLSATSVKDWMKLSASEHAALVISMGDWVDWAVQTYRLNKQVVPQCWYLHTAIVQELYAMKSLYTLCFSAEDSGAGPATFLERFSASQGRLRLITGDSTCKSGQHQEPSSMGSWTDRQASAWQDLEQLAEGEDDNE